MGSIDTYDNIETLELASLLESHEVLEFRRIAAYLYKQNSKWQKSIELSKKDEKWKDVIDTAASSKNQDLVTNLLKYFVEIGRKDCFSACLFTCYSLISPDVVMELAWKNGMMDSAMPFFIQTMKNMNERLQEVENRVLPKENEVASMSGADQVQSTMVNQCIPQSGSMGMIPQGGMMQGGMMPQGGSMNQPMDGFGNMGGFVGANQGN